MGSVAPNLPHPLDDDGMELPIAIRDAAHSRTVEKNYRGLLIGDGLREAARALAEQLGAEREARGNHDPYPFEILLATQLAQMEGRYRGLLEAAPDAMVVVNQGGEIVLLNVQAEKQFGYSPRRAPRAAGHEHHSEGLRRAADRRRHCAPRPRRWRSRSAPASSSSARRKDGSEFPIEIMLSPLESAEGILVTAAIRDISVRKAAETHLAQMEGRYRGLLEAAPDAMVVVNQAGEIVLLNVQAEKQFGYSPRRARSASRSRTSFPKGFAERLIADGTRTAAEALAQQIGTGIELSARRKDGSEFPDRDHAEPAARAPRASW